MLLWGWGTGKVAKEGVLKIVNQNSILIIIRQLTNEVFLALEKNTNKHLVGFI